MVINGWPKLNFTAVKVTELHRESTHPLQLNTIRQSCCTASYQGATDRLSPCVGMITCFGFGKQKHFRNIIMPTQGDNLSVKPVYEAAKQVCFLVLSGIGWADSLSNPVMALTILVMYGAK